MPAAALPDGDGSLQRLERRHSQEMGLNINIQRLVYIWNSEVHISLLKTISPLKSIFVGAYFAFNIFMDILSEVSRVCKYGRVRMGRLRNHICDSEAEIHQPIQIWQFLPIEHIELCSVMKYLKTKWSDVEE